MASLDDAFAELWRAVKKTVPLNQDAAIYKAWRTHYAEWGSPIGAEQPLDGGGVFQVFTHAVVTWSPEDGAVVVSA